MDSVMKEGALGAILFKSQIITEDDIRTALAEQQQSGCRFGEALIKRGIVTQEDIDWALSYQLNIPYVRLNKELVDPQAAALVPAALARQFNLMPIVRVGDELSVAMADPLNHTAIGEVERVSGCRVTVSVGFIREIREMQDYCYGAAATVHSFGFSSTSFPAKVLQEIDADLTGAVFLDYLMMFFFQKKLSSLSLVPLGDTVAVTGRKGSETREIGRLALTYYPDFLFGLRKLARIVGMADTVARGRIPFTYKGKELQFQLFFLQGCGGDYVTLKQYVAAQFPANLGELGVAAEKEAAFRALAGQRQGLVLVTHFDEDERCRLMDIFIDECNVSRRSVMLFGSRLGRGETNLPRFAFDHDPRMILAALDHAPDIIAIDDVSNGELFIAACKAALRGTLVVAGLALHDLESTFGLLHNFWRRNFFLPSLVKGIVSCKGVPTLCPACREPHAPSPDELAMLHLSAVGGYFSRCGCAKCDQTGYAGTRYLLDLLPFDQGLLAAFEAAEESAQVLDYLHTTGYRGNRAEGAELLQAGAISPGDYIASILN